MSITMTPPPIVAALLKAEKLLGVANDELGYDWKSFNDKQEQFLEDFYHALGRKEVQEMKDMVSIASKDVNVLNNFLKAKGFDIQLDQFSRGDSFGIVSILKIVLEWFEKGKKATIKTPGQTYLGAKLKLGNDPEGEKAILLEIPTLPNPLVMIPTKNDYGVFMILADEVPTDGFDLIEKIQDMMGKVEDSPERHLSTKYGNVIFPQIDYNEEIDISWLRGMEIEDPSKVSWSIAQALQQTKFRMDEIGAVVESAAALEMQIRSFIAPNVKPDYVIDKPFFMGAGNLKTTSNPVFYGYLTPEDWIRGGIGC